MDWSISALDCRVQEDNLSDVVYCVHWRVSKTEVDGDKTYSASVYSTCSVPGPNPASFVPYDQLTQNEVLGWIWANGVNKDATEAAVQAQINNQKNPKTIQPPLPWATPSA
jgi:hypothetical protein